MYDWLGDALRESAVVATASRRLARELANEYAARQLADNCKAWRSPAIHAWQDWLSRLLAAARDQAGLPTRINAHHSRILWERCLRREIADPLTNMSLLVRQARESWSRMQEFGVTLDECSESAKGRDQRLFAAAAASYQSVLERECWVDDTGIADLVAGLVEEGGVELPDQLTLAGFDRVVPRVSMLLERLRENGVTVARAGRRDVVANTELHVFDNRDEELRSAGAWVRQQLLEKPDQRIGIVVTNLEREAGRCSRLVREGLAPGWQHAGPRHAEAVNVSYGQPLSAYPACAIALLLLRWLHGELAGRDISLILRSPFLAAGEPGGRTRLELRLRRMPDRRWTPAMFLREFGEAGDHDGSEAWLDAVNQLDALRQGLNGRDSPARWAASVDEALTCFAWPGEESLSSPEFQLINRWRELLNELARLDLVSPKLSIAEAVSRLNAMAAETIFQPEAEDTLVQVIGPLEAAGMQFDRIWISGLGSAEWPPPSRPLALLSRDLQRRYRMPDSEPADTLDFAAGVLSGLLSCAPVPVCSYSRTHGDTEQTATGLLAGVVAAGTSRPQDPGWYAAALVETGSAVPATADPAPSMRPDEKLAGGAAVLQRQLEEPFSAFVLGRLGVNLLQPITVGLAPSVRGSLIHGALQQLYRKLPAQSALRNWDEPELERRVENAVDKAFRGIFRTADAVLLALLRLETSRASSLLRAVVELDRGREPFAVAAVEKPLSVTIEGVSLSLRADRIDRLDSGEHVILDYKTGAPRHFLGSDKEPKDIQLVVYAYALGEAVSDLGLVNVDSRNVDIDGAGRTLTPDIDWAAVLPAWCTVAERAARELRRGDIRLSDLHNLQSERPLSLLSRSRELRNDA